jgi:anti-sigma B factor antagonist
MILWWGPELRFLYNDAYLPLLGDKHPALGRPGRQVITPLELSISRGTDGLTVLSAAGEIDMSNAARFRAALGQAGADGGGFVVDLTRVDYLDSAGLTALLPHSGQLAITATELLAPVLTVSGLAPVTTVVPAA